MYHIDRNARWLVVNVVNRLVRLRQHTYLLKVRKETTY